MSSVQSQFVLINSIESSNDSSKDFGKNIEWLGNDTFSVVSDVDGEWISNTSPLSDSTIFDGGSTNFGNSSTEERQNLEIFQILTTDRSWINSTHDVIQTVPVNTITVTGNNPADSVVTGGTENLFISDSGNPDNSIVIYGNPNLSPGWVVSTQQEEKLDPQSISQAWIYDSVTQIKLTDLEVVDLSSGIMPGAIAENIDYTCDIDPAIYNIPSWVSGTSYNINDRVIYGGKLYQSKYTGKSGAIFNPNLWSIVENNTNKNVNGITLWGSSQVGKTWFRTKNLKVINAQLGDITERAQNWNKWFPNSTIDVFEWVNSIYSPQNFVGSDSDGYVESTDIDYTYDTNTGLYGFWVKNKTINGPLHEQSIVQISQSLSDIPNSGIPMISVIDTNSVAVWNIDQYSSSNTIILHIDYVNESGDSQLHNEFALISNDGTKSWYKTTIYPKLVDSLTGVTTSDILVPDYTIPPSQQTGILNNPSQSLFIDRAEAVNVYFSEINQKISNVAIADSATITLLTAIDPVPTSGFDATVSTREVLNQLTISDYPENYRILIQSDDYFSTPKWSIVSAIDGVWQFTQCQLYDLSDYWTYTDWYSTEYTNDTPIYTLNNIGELSSISYIAGDVIAILNNGNGKKSIYKAVVNDIDLSVTDLIQIYIQDGTIQFLPNLYDFLKSDIGFDNGGFDSVAFDNDPYIPIRKITEILNDNVFVGDTNLTQIADDGFFSVIDFILQENENLDWLFKTSFIKARYNNRILTNQSEFEADNSSIIENFLDETLPFHTRIREFNNTYTANDYANIGATDFDLPSQYDKNYAELLTLYTPNPKLNAELPANQFGNNNGILVTSDTLYVNAPSGSYAIPLSPSVDGVQYDAPTSWAGLRIGPEAIGIDGVAIFNSNSGYEVTVYNQSNLALSQTLTINNDSLYSFTDHGNSNTHSQIIGYAFDGYPIYGSWGYDSNGNIIENTSSWKLSTTPRLDYANAIVHNNSILVAPLITPDGSAIEDFYYDPSYGTLDECNGKFAITPEYPNGTYAYFATSTYPYFIGPRYQGIPYGTNYEYVNGVNTPFYPNGNVVIPFTSAMASASLVRTPDGSISSDSDTLQESVYLPWTNNYPNYISDINFNTRGSGYMDLSAIVTVTPANNSNIVVSGLRLVSANIVTSGNNYQNGDIISLVGGTYSNAATMIVSSTNSYGGITGIQVINSSGQEYTVVPPDTNNTQISTNTSNGFGASFQVSFGIDTFNIVSSGEFSSTPSISISDANATVEANVYPILDNDNIRSINTRTRFDRVGYVPEYADPNCLYPSGYVVYDSANSVFRTSLINNASGANLSNTTYWKISSNEEVGNSTEMNRIVDFYHTPNNVSSNATTLLSTEQLQTVVNVSGGNLALNYTVPSGSLFDQEVNDYQSLNLSWRPELITDNILTNNSPRFGNSCANINTVYNQYIIANNSSEDLNTLVIGTAPFTIEFFINLTSTGNMTLVDTRSSTASTNGFVIYTDGLSISMGSNASSYFIKTPNILTTNEWNFVVINSDGSNVCAYINGQLLETSSTSYNFTDYHLTLGADVGGGNVANCYMDEIRLTRNTHRYEIGVVDIPVPSVPFPRNITNDVYLTKLYTPLLWGFENFINEGASNILFESVNSSKTIADLSWNRKNLNLISYGSNLVIDSTTINTLSNPSDSAILSVTING